MAHQADIAVGRGGEEGRSYQNREVENHRNEAVQEAERVLRVGRGIPAHGVVEVVLWVGFGRGSARKSQQFVVRGETK